MRRNVRLGLVLVPLACATWASAGEVAVEEARVDATEASEVAQELAVEAAAISIGSGGSRTEGEEKLQAQVDKMAALAVTLDTQIRAGAAKSETRPVYEELRKARLEALGLAMSGKAEIAPADGAFFELLIRDLGRYHDAN